MTQVPAMRVEVIPALETHYEAFAYKHPMEITALTGLCTGPQGTIVEGLEVRELFTLESEPLGVVVIDVTGLKRALAARRVPLEMYEAHLNQEWVDYTMRSNGCEEAGIARLKAADLLRPGILIRWGGDHTTLVDGAHCLVRRWRDGLTTVQFAHVLFTPAVLPYVARPGEEAKFYNREEEWA